MTVTEALAKWSEACSATKAGNVLVRDGNWQEIKRALRHFKDDTATIVENDDKLNGDTVLLVTPAEAEGEPLPGKTRFTRPPFLLLVR